MCVREKRTPRILQLVLETHIKGSIKRRGKRLASLANDVLGVTVFIAHRIRNLINDSSGQ